MTNGEKKTSQMPAGLPTEAQVARYELISPMIDALYGDMQDLSKKKPDGPVNQTKVRVINRLLSAVRELLKSHASLEFLDLLSEEDLPSSSDCTLILGQYQASMTRFKAQYYGLYDGDYRWLSQENPK